MKKCSECKGTMEELTEKTPEGVGYSYYKCTNCGEEIVNMQQLHDVAEAYRTLKRYNVRLSRWGMSLGLRIPKDLVQRYGLKNTAEVSIIPEKKGMKIVV